MIVGNVAIVLNAHFPYVRHDDRWPHGEDGLHAVIAESYVPLLRMLLDLRRGNEPLPLTLSISPILLEQLADPLLPGQVIKWMADWRTRAEVDLSRYIAYGNGHGAYLARFYLEWIDSIAQCFTERFGGNLITAIRNALTNAVDVLLAPATYAYLPHLSQASINAQLKTGVLPLVRSLGRRPIGLWLPGGVLGKIEKTLVNELGLQYAVGMPQPQSVSTTSVPLPTLHPDHMVIDHVTAPAVGYPGDGLYREFYRHHPDSGIAYWRVTSIDTPLEHKAWYDPYLAFNRADEHAAHFLRAIQQRLQALAAQGQPPALVLAFDAELFGHWWFEGVHWLHRVLEQLRASPMINLVTVKQVDLPTVDNPDGDFPHPLFDHPALDLLHQQIDTATAGFESIVQRNPAADGMQEALLTQAARELMLAQSSDWMALIAAGTAPEYAERRLHEHLQRFMRLLCFAEHDYDSPTARQQLDDMAALDDPFRFLNYRVFG